MTIEIRVPVLGESVTEATVGRWFKAVGEPVAADELLVELETDKITVEVPAPAAGMVEAIAVRDGETVTVGALLGTLGATSPAARTDAVSSIAAAASPTPPAAGAPATAAPLSPAVRKLVLEGGLDIAALPASGKDGRITKADVLVATADGSRAAPPRTAPPAPALAPVVQTPAAALPPMAAMEPAHRTPAPSPPAPSIPLEPAAAAPPVPAAPVAPPPSPPAPAAADAPPLEQRVRMTRLRQTIARRLKDAQNVAAMLTTFNEVDMSAVLALRGQYKELFEKTHGVKLGFMGFFVKAAVLALKEIPAVNAEIDGTDIVYKNYYHIGVAVSTERGLVVPVVRDADRLSLAAIERTIAGLGQRARDGALAIEELQGGTFTISNGGVFGSLMSTPILNAPQSGILGMHKIQERPVVLDGAIVARPMMYLALSYDHRLVDGREAVTFLVRIKEALEDPQRLVLEL